MCSQQQATGNAGINRNYLSACKHILKQPFISGIGIVWNDGAKISGFVIGLNNNFLYNYCLCL